MALYPECRVVLEGSGAVVTTLPPFASWPPVDSKLHLEINGGGVVKYKVEGYETHVHTIGQVVDPPGSPKPVGVECYTKMIVSVVP